MKGQDKADNIERKSLVLIEALAARVEALELLAKPIDLPQPIVSAIESPKRGPGRPRKGDAQAGRNATGSDRAA